MISVEKVERSLAFPVIDMRDLGESEDDSQESLNRQTRKIWFADPVFSSLQKLADGLGVSKVIFAERTASDSTQGQYLFRAPTHHLEGWLLSSRLLKNCAEPAISVLV
jgi:hypothetical protein